MCGHRDDSAYYDSEDYGNFQVISCCADVINQQIIAEIKQSKFYAILADEVTDCANKEQMPFVIRYVDKDCNIQERFLTYILCDTGITGLALQKKIVSYLTDELKLDLMDCRGQCYDGAGNMAGKYSGLSTRILAMNDLALYTHCASHR